VPTECLFGRGSIIFKMQQQAFLGTFLNLGDKNPEIDLPYPVPACHDLTL